MEYRGVIHEFFDHVLSKDDYSAKKCLQSVLGEIQYLRKKVDKKDEEHVKSLESFVDTVAKGNISVAWGKTNKIKSTFDSYLRRYLQSDSNATKGNNGGQSKERQTRQDLSYHHHEQYSGSDYEGTGNRSGRHPNTSMYYQGADKTCSNKNDYQTENVEVADVLRRKQQSGSEDQNYVNLKRSKRASQKIVQNNPEIADLSDVNRPTKLAEGFSELYDNEWTEAFEVLRKIQSNKLSEKDIITLLLDIVEEAYQFCLKEADEQINDIEAQFARILIGEMGSKTQPNPSGRNLLVQYRKSMAERALERIQRNFTSKLNELCRRKLSTEPAEGKPTVKFAQKAVELCWWMCVQDPPVHMCLTKQEPFNPALYKAYTKSGNELDFFVWPALKLHRDGGVLSKGVAQFK